MSDASSNPTQTQDMNFTTLLAVIFSCTSAVGLIIISVACVVYVQRRKRRQQQHRDVTTKLSICKGFSSTGSVTKSSNQAGVIQRQSIEFVLPSYTSAEPTEEEASEYEPGNYKFSYIHAQPGNVLVLPVGNSLRKGPTGGLIKPDSIAPSLYMSSEGEEDQNLYFPDVNLGKVGFTLKFKKSANQLMIHVVGALNLPVKRAGKTISNPHVKVTVLPEKNPKFFTKVVKNTANPVYNEEFAVAVKRADVTSKTLQITMCDFDRFTRRIAVGHVFVPLKTIAMVEEAGPDEVVLLQDEWRSLVPKYLASEEIQGEIFLSLCYNSDIKNLRLGIHKVRNLKSENEDLVCLYAKVSLIENGKVLKTRKTSAVKKTLEPDFAETFNIKINREGTQSIFCTISVCSRNRYGSARKVIGRTQIGPYTLVSGPGAEHWNDAFQSPKSTVTQWHTLR